MATALVTGGTSGIGAEFARQLAASGYDLVLVARNPDRLASAAERLHADSGINVETISADLSDRADVARVAARIEDAEHPIDLLVNNAGEGFRTALASADVAAHEHAFDVMCRAVLVLGGAAARAMSGRRGTIINISSLQTYLATGAYAANKAWVTAYSQSLAVELRGTGIGVTVVLPGWVRTEWHERAGVRRSSLPGFLWTQPEAVVRIALRDARRGKVVCIPTVRYRVLGWFARHLPNAAVRRISAGISSGRDEASPSDSAGGAESSAMKADTA
ncbi:MAG TPA: SDR family NAD(P)-dependent oxidoreductase [Rhodoglobus sp.]|nr:SDR family NAD(P)-dependent oxidoreductase [Rhodoglobus sp.]HPG76062.1 SDR family NAD(P)-dependent oxidoreductase [Rhodoglobus sp.]HPM51367.1 SDR family NAD(P)-dependent oxidoreductase [Rhodoglobus sp.]HPU03112.1 SDR family NAD(P)-dependent oxidoreductase [Rhodoglobus sp.]